MTATVVALDGSASSDANGDPLTFTWTMVSKPPGSAAVLAGAASAAPTFFADEAGTYVMSLVVNDGHASSAASTVTIVASVPITASAPQITSTPATSAMVGVAYSYAVYASDANGDALTYSLTQAPAGMTIDAGTGLTAWTPASTQTGSQAVTARVADPRGLYAEQAFTVTVANAASAPQITSAPATSAQVGVSYSYDVNASDANGDALAYSLTQAPAGMTINASTGLIAWTPAPTQTGSQAVTARVADPGGSYAKQSFTINVGSAATPLVVPGNWVVIGSSTAAGDGATTGQAWVARLQSHVSARGVVIANLAVGGTTTYAGLPTSSAPVIGRPLPDDSSNIDAGLAFRPNLVLVAYPTNDTSEGFSVAETVTNLLAIRSYAQTRDASVIVQGTQPRNLSDSQRALLPQIDAQLAAAIGPCFVNVRSLLASADGRINPNYDSGDGVHLNDAGHDIIFNRLDAVLDSGACVRANSP